MSTGVWGTNMICLLPATGITISCLSSRDSESIGGVTIETQPSKLPDVNSDRTSRDCRIRNEIPLGDITTLNLPAMDLQTLPGQNQNLPKDVPPRNAASSEVNFIPATHGKWETADNNTQIWRLKIISPQTLSRSLGFTTFNMPAEGYLFAYSPYRHLMLGPYTSSDNEEHGQLWTPAIDGWEVLIEITMPEESISILQMVLGFVNQEYK